MPRPIPPRRHRPLANAAVLLVVAALAMPARSSAADPAPPQTTSPGVISGKVVDSSSGEPIIDAGVEIVGRKQQTRSDIDGRYRFEVPAGSWDIRVFAPGYQGARVTRIAVEPGRPATADVALAPSADGAVEVVEVVAQANRAAEATQILQRKNADVIEDTISAEVVRKSPDSDAGEIVERIPAVTVRDDKYVYVRGLGERYSSALLDGSRLPSTDPDKRVVPLDLFPAQFIESLAIIKSYSPDLPGDFSGGLVDIQLRSSPDAFAAKAGLSIGGNSASTLQRFLDYPGSANPLGIAADNGLPSLFGDETIGAPPAAEAERYAAALPNVWEPDSMTAPPNFGLNATVGNRWGALGMNLGASWTNGYKVEHDVIERQFTVAGSSEQPTIVLTDDFLYDYDVFETGLGAVYTAGYDIDEGNRIDLEALYNRNTESRVEIGRGYTSQNSDQTNNVTRLEYRQEQLVFGQLRGDHHLPWLDVDWRTAFSQTTQDTPDTRTTNYVSIPDDPSAPPVFSTSSQGGTRVYFDITEHMSDSAVDAKIPFMTGLPFTDAWSGLPAFVKLGPAFTHRERTSNLRQFRYIPRGASDFTLPPETLLAPPRVGAGEVDFQETTHPRDSFYATEDIIGFYAMADLPILEKLLRLVAGARGEYSYIHLTTANDQGRRIENNIRNLDPLPSVSLIGSPRDDMSIRFGWSQTVSRPEFRELSPVFFPEPRGLRPTIGNPFLIESHITNLDLRWDWFLSSLDLVSLSLFFKEIDDPIEQVVIAQSSNAANSFANAESANVEGIELEVRKELGFVVPWMEGLSLSANLALIDSEVKAAPPTPTQVQTSSQRPLQGQAPYVVNLMLDYTRSSIGSLRLLYNTAGRSVDALGAYGLPDIYRETRQQLDFVFLRDDVPIFGTPIDIKLSAENLLDDRYLLTQGGQTQERYKKGVSVALSFSYDF